MKASEVERVIHAEPFRPYRLTLTDGEEVLVRQPRKSHVSGDQVALVGESRKPGGAAVERFRIIHVDRVASAQVVNVPPKSSSTH